MSNPYAGKSYDELQNQWDAAVEEERRLLERRGRKASLIAAQTNADEKHPGLREALIATANR